MAFNVLVLSLRSEAKSRSLFVLFNFLVANVNILQIYLFIQRKSFRKLHFHYLLTYFLTIMKYRICINQMREDNLKLIQQVDHDQPLLWKNTL